MCKKTFASRHTLLRAYPLHTSVSLLDPRRVFLPNHLFYRRYLFLHEHRVMFCEIALQSFNGDDVDRLTAVVPRGRHTILDERFPNVPDPNVGCFRFPKLFLEKRRRNVCFLFQDVEQSTCRLR